MFGWFASKPECPVDLPTSEWIERRWAWLTEQFGPERLRSTRVILPTPEFFPESYTGADDDARMMLDRVCGYMGIAPETVELSLYQDRNPVYDGEWRQGTSGLYHEEAGKFRIWVETGNLDDPLGLVATIAHELGHVHLLGHGRVSPDADDHEPLTDLLTVYLGMGLLTANAVIREHYWDAGAVSGWSMGRRGYLSMPMYGYALALFANARAEVKPAWAKHLRPDVRSAFDMAHRFLAERVQTDVAWPPATPIPAEEPTLEAEDPAPDDDDASCESLSAEELLERYARGDRDFRNLCLQGLRLCGADLRGSDLAGADLSRADLTDAVLSESDLHESDLQEAVLRGTTLHRANLAGVDLSGADLTGADLSDADIRGADFSEGLLDQTVLVRTLRDSSTDFSEVDLSKAISDVDLNKENLRGDMLSDRLAGGFDRTSRGVGLIVYFGLATMAGALVGALAGTVLSVGMRIKGLTDTGALIGAISFSILSVRKLMLSREQENAHGPDSS